MTETCRKLVVTETTLYRWKRQFGGVGSSQDLVEMLSQEIVGRFGLFGTDSVKMVGAARSIAKGVDVLRGVGLREFAVLVELLLDPSLRQAAEAGSQDAVIPAIPHGAHARLQAMGAAEPTAGVAAVVRALIPVYERAARPPLPHGHEHGVEHDPAVNRRTAGQADHLAQEQV